MNTIPEIRFFDQAAPADEKHWIVHTGEGDGALKFSLATVNDAGTVTSTMQWMSIERMGSRSTEARVNLALCSYRIEGDELIIQPTSPA